MDRFLEIVRNNKVKLYASAVFAGVVAAAQVLGYEVPSAVKLAVTAFLGL
jgi:hypothetical protein